MLTVVYGKQVNYGESPVRKHNKMAKSLVVVHMYATTKELKTRL